jgi:hypothetical protein
VKEYKNFYGKVVVASAKEYNTTVKATVDPIKVYKDSDPDVLYEFFERGKNPLLIKKGYMVMAFPKAVKRVPEGYPIYRYEEKDAKDEDDAIMKAKEDLLVEIANGSPQDPFLVKLFEGIDIRVGLFF